MNHRVSEQTSHNTIPEELKSLLNYVTYLKQSCFQPKLTRHDYILLSQKVKDSIAHVENFYLSLEVPPVDTSATYQIVMFIVCVLSQLAYLSNKMSAEVVKVEKVQELFVTECEKVVKSVPVQTQSARSVPYVNVKRLREVSAVNEEEDESDFEAGWQISESMTRSDKRKRSLKTQVGKARPNHSPEVKSVLIAWFNANITCPYPSEKDKSQLVMLAGINRSQLNNWLINQRRRSGLKFSKVQIK